MKKLLLSLVLAFAIIGVAEAQIPSEVLKPYKEYQTALENKENAKAYKSAKKAWETAEKLMGDSKTTGDLAANYAILTPGGKINTYKEFQSRMKAHDRSIKLSKFYDAEQVANIELDRHIKRIETSMNLVRANKNGSNVTGKYTYFTDMEKALDKYDLRGSTFEGDLEVLRVRYYGANDKPKKGVEAAQRAEMIYKNRRDNFSTHYPIMLKLFKGNVLKDAGEPIQAVLEYQDVMQNLEGRLPADHVFISAAFKEWVKTRTDLVDAGRFKEAEAAGLCRCWPFEEYAEDVIPLERIPPAMPRNAKRSGHVNLVFDVDETGKPFNIRVLSSTEDIFEEPAIASVEKWQYSPVGHGETEAKIRKGVASKITFRLTNRQGKIIPEKKDG